MTLPIIMGLWSCENDEPSNIVEEEVSQIPLSMTVSHSSSTTRTDLSEDINFGLSDKWVKGDKLKIFNSSGEEVGELELINGEGSNTGYFKGNLNKGNSGEYCIWYFGQPNNEGSHPYKMTISNGQVIFDFKDQSFSSISALSQADIMSSQVNIKIDGDNAYVENEVTMSPKMAMCRFALKKDNKSLGKIGTLKIRNAKKITTKTGVAFNLSTGESVENKIPCSEDGINVQINGQNDFYVALAPDEYLYNFIFTTNSNNNNEQYTYQAITSKTLSAGKYYCKRPEQGSSDVNLSGIEVNMEPMVELDDEIFGIKWAPCNTRSWLDAKPSISDPIAFNYIPNIPLADQGIQMEYSNQTILGEDFNNKVYYYQWNRYFGFIGATEAYNSSYKTKLPNYDNLSTKWKNNWGTYKKIDGTQSLGDAQINIEELYSPTNKNDWCTTHPTKWENRKDYGSDGVVITAPEGFSLPTSDDLYSLLPYDECLNNEIEVFGTSILLYDDDLKNIQGTAKPFYIRQLENGTTAVWSIWSTANTNFLDIRILPSKFSKDQLNYLTMKSDVYIHLPAAGNIGQEGSGMNYNLSGSYWASETTSQLAQAGGAWALRFTFDSASNPNKITFQFGGFARKNGFSLRLKYE